MMGQCGTFAILLSIFLGTCFAQKDIIYTPDHGMIVTSSSSGWASGWPGNTENSAVEAVVVLQGTSVKGVVTFSQQDVNQPILIHGEISGLSPGWHGFHVHAKGDLRNGCASAGGHYNPFAKDHGAPSDSDRHVGDLGNIVADSSGVASFTITDQLVKLSGPYSVLGRAVVVHQDADDLGRGGYSDSKTTGHAGARVACGVIGIA